MPPGYGGSLVGGELGGTITDGTGDDATDDDIGDGTGAGVLVSLPLGRKYPMTRPSSIAREIITMAREVGMTALSLFI
jgi:hypothetical protein